MSRRFLSPVTMLNLTADPVTPPPPGSVYWNTVTNTLRIYTGTAWVNSHGSLLGGTNHSVATTSADGFMSASDKTKLDAYQTAWTSYTPTWTPGTLGNGVLSGAYRQIGKTVYVRIKLVWGSTTAPGAGAWAFALPGVTGRTNSNAVLTGLVWRSATGAGRASTWEIRTGATAIFPGWTLATATSGGNVVDVAVGAGNPWTWAAGDSVFITGVFETD